MEVRPRSDSLWAVHSRFALALIALVTACGTSDAAGSDGSIGTTPVATLGGVGELPETIPPDRGPLVVVTRPGLDDAGNPVEAVGEQVAGNRLLMIGDSILAGTAERYGGDMCAALVPLGWAVEVDAEPGRFVEFGTEVLDERLDPVAGTEEDWDAAAVHLGSNYAKDRERYEAELTEILERLAPRPTLLYTVTEYRPAWAEVNEVVRAAAERFDHVTLADWEDLARTPGVLGGDGLHPTAAGEQVLVDLTVSALGPAFGNEGECLPTSFTDDSLVGSGDAPASRPVAGSASDASGPDGGDSGSSGDGGVGDPGTDPSPDEQPEVTDPPPETPPPPTQPPAVTDPPPATDPPAPPTDPPPPNPPVTDGGA